MLKTKKGAEPIENSRINVGLSNKKKIKMKKKKKGVKSPIKNSTKDAVSNSYYFLEQSNNNYTVNHTVNNYNNVVHQEKVLENNSEILPKKDTVLEKFFNFTDRLFLFLSLFEFVKDNATENFDLFVSYLKLIISFFESLM